MYHHLLVVEPVVLGGTATVIVDVFSGIIDTGIVDRYRTRWTW